MTRAGLERATASRNSGSSPARVIYFLELSLHNDSKHDSQVPYTVF